LFFPPMWGRCSSLSSLAEALLRNNLAFPIRERIAFAPASAAILLDNHSKSKSKPPQMGGRALKPMESDSPGGVLGMVHRVRTIRRSEA
jgi:hypothetical protein